MVMDDGKDKLGLRYKIYGLRYIKDLRFGYIYIGIKIEFKLHTKI